MEPLNNDLKEFIELHTLLSSEYKKCPLSGEDLDYYAGSFANLLRARLHQCLEAGDRHQAVKLISEIQASIRGIERSLRGKLHGVTAYERDLFNREWKARYSPRPGVPSKAERQKATRTAYEKMMRSMGHDRSR